MTSSIKEKLIPLVTLQQLESEMARIEKELAGVDAHIDVLTSRITAFEGQVAEGQGRLDALKKQYRSDESEMKILENRIAKSEEKLRAVKTNKEYQSMLKEIDDLKEKISGMEDQMLQMLEQIETTEAEVASQKADLADLKQEVEAQQAQIHSAAEAQRRRGADLAQQRDEIWKTLAPELQKMYLRVKKQGRGVAVAAVVEAVCQVCRMNIPPQLFNELLRMDELRMCPNCQRIIYPKAALE